MRSAVLVRIVFIFSSLICAASVEAKFEKEEADIDALLAKRHYASAAAYINNRTDLLDEPRFLRQLSHILVTYHSTAINFGLFALKDLKEGESLEQVRGAKGTHQMVGGDWEKVLYDALKARPDSTDINFAVGEYLSRGSACGCSTPSLFVGQQGDEFQYLDRAYKGGVYDYWSLFRMGNYYTRKPHVDLKLATSFYSKSLELDPNYTETHFNLSSLYYAIGDYKNAQTHAAKTLDKYSDAAFNADAYANYARVEAALGDRASAEKNYLKAFQLKPWHESTFVGLVDLYRTDKRFDVYKKVVKDYIALDYANTYTFNVYVDYLGIAKMIDADRAIARELATQKYSRAEETGAIFFNLGRMAELDGDNTLALQRYAKSLDTFKKLDKPPAGSVEAVTQLIGRLQKQKVN